MIAAVHHGLPTRPAVTNNFKSLDRRKFNKDGSPRATRRADGKPSIAFSDIDQPVKRAHTYLQAQIGAGMKNNNLQPAEFWSLLWGLFTSAKLIYLGIASLMAERQPKRLVIPAAILSRALLEALGNVMGLVQDPANHTVLFTKDGYLNAWRQVQQLRPYADGPEWKEWAAEADAKLEQFGRRAGLSMEEMANPQKLIKEWPRMGNIFRPNGLLKGDRAGAFGLLYTLWYKNLSAFAHQRIAAAAQAWVMEEGDLPFDMELAVSNVFFAAAMSMAAILSEIQVTGSFQARPDLPALWAILERHHPTARRLMALRYAKVLGIPVPPEP